MQRRDAPRSILPPRPNRPTSGNKSIVRGCTSSQQTQTIASTPIYSSNSITTTTTTKLSLFNELDLVACTTGVVCRKEFLETYAAAACIHAKFSESRRMADLAAGHGLLSWFLLAFDLTDDHDHGNHSSADRTTTKCQPRQRTVTCVDRRMPRSAEIFAAAMIERFPSLEERWSYVQSDLSAVAPTIAATRDDDETTMSVPTNAGDDDDGGLPTPAVSTPFPTEDGFVTDPLVAVPSTPFPTVGDDDGGGGTLFPSETTGGGDGNSGGDGTSINSYDGGYDNDYDGVYDSSYDGHDGYDGYSDYGYGHSTASHSVSHSSKSGKKSGLRGKGGKSGNHGDGGGRSKSDSSAHHDHHGGKSGGRSKGGKSGDGCGKSGGGCDSSSSSSSLSSSSDGHHGDNYGYGDNGNGGYVGWTTW